MKEIGARGGASLALPPTSTNITCKSESFKILKQPCSIGASTNEIIESLN